MFFREREASASKHDEEGGVVETASSVKLGLSTEVAVDDARVQAEERRLKRKFDWLLLPPLTVMYALICSCCRKVIAHSAFEGTFATLWTKET